MKVWIVRHAEKEQNPTNPQDPVLSPDGALRAEALMQSLKGKKLDTIYTTAYKRTKLTAFPLADKQGISLQEYDPTKPSHLVNMLKQKAAGKSVLIVGHSNTIIPLIEAFGAKSPLDSIGDNEYDNLFYLQVKGDKVSVELSKYRDKPRPGEL